MKKNTVVKPREKRSSHDLSCQSLTTTDLFKIKPVFSRLTIPNDHFNINTSQINRVDALPVSSFVNIKNQLAWFYVKNVQVWKPWDSFITQAPYAFGGSNVVPSNVPYISPLDFCALMCQATNQSLLGLSTYVDISSSVQTIDDAYQIYESTSYNYDRVFVELNSDSTINKAYGTTFTPKGRMVYDIMYALGYRFPEVVIEGDADYNAQRMMYSGMKMSLIPLLSYLSVLVNYYTPVKFRSYAFINSVSYLVNPYPSHQSDWVNTGFNSDTLSFWYNVTTILTSVFYGSDYFTDSLQSPYLGTTNYIKDPADNFSPYSFAAGNLGNVAPQVDMPVDGDNETYLTQYLISALQAVTSKNQLAALTKNDVVGRALSMFGYKPEVADMVPFLLSHKNSNIYVSPQVSQSDTFDGTDGKPLGYKAGNGEGMIKDYDCNFDFDSYGQLICISSVSPDIMYTYGLSREMLHTDRDLCFDPAFVNLGYQGIGKCELNMFYIDDTTGQGPQSTFGFQNKYAELGYRRDFMSGDFCMRSRNAGLDSFHFFRKLLPVDVVNTARFALARAGSQYSPNGEGQYDRIFFDQSHNNDHIQQWNIFEIKADRDIPYNGEFSVGDDNNGKEQEVGRPSEVLNA